jgi:large subunit ribosomal protein L11
VANIASGSGEANKKKVAKISKAQLLEATKLKLADLNTQDLEHASRIMAGTARQMGIEITD